MAKLDAAPPRQRDAGGDARDAGGRAVSVRRGRIGRWHRLDRHRHQLRWPAEAGPATAGRRRGRQPAATVAGPGFSRAIMSTAAGALALALSRAPARCAGRRCTRSEAVARCCCWWRPWRQRYGAVLRRANFRPPSAGAAPQPEEDDRRRHRRLRRRADLSVLRRPVPPAGSESARDRAARCGAGRGRHRRRSLRVDAQARGRREGQLDAHSRATAACSIASTRCCSRRRSSTCICGGW